MQIDDAEAGAEFEIQGSLGGLIGAHVARASLTLSS
jgi:hypothetical protein